MRTHCRCWCKDESPDDEETVASEKEIGWWKRFQVARALNKTRYEVATPWELSLLRHKEVVHSWRAKQKTKKKMGDAYVSVEGLPEVSRASER